MLITAKVIPAAWVDSNNPPALEQCRWRFLAEGDSWFSLTAIELLSASNFLYEMKFSKLDAIVCCAYPGDELKHMVDKIRDKSFYRLFADPHSYRYWDAILLSASGNDLIAGVNIKPIDPETGILREKQERLLLTPAEVENPNNPLDYISNEGWLKLTTYLLGCYSTLLSWRQNSPSASRPIFTHTYAVPIARPAGAFPWDKGWLYPALETYQVKPEKMQEVVQTLFSKLRDFLLSLDCQSESPNALPYFHVYDSSSVPLSPATEGVSGESGDWINEIHLTKAGYKKIAPLYAKFVEDKLSQY